jgi:hypothetical protein
MLDVDTNATVGAVGIMSRSEEIPSAAARAFANILSRGVTQHCRPRLMVTKIGSEGPIMSNGISGALALASATTPFRATICVGSWQHERSFFQN